MPHRPQGTWWAFLLFGGGRENLCLPCPAFGGRVRLRPRVEVLLALPEVGTGPFYAWEDSSSSESKCWECSNYSLQVTSPPQMPLDQSHYCYPNHFHFDSLASFPTIRYHPSGSALSLGLWITSNGALTRDWTARYWTFLILLPVTSLHKS